MDISAFTNDNTRNALVSSPVPEVCRGEPCVLGVDEAGRGPVLGPMVYGICYCPLARHGELKEAGVADSKTLKEPDREKIFEIINSKNDFVGWSLEIMSPAFITSSMYRRPKVSLNEISHNSAIGLIQQAVDAGIQVAEVYVDTVGDPEKYQDKLQKIFPTVKVTVAKKADALFPCVSGASICAKVARDKALADWAFPEDIEVKNWGSGYPNDPATKNFLLNTVDPIFGFPELVRFSWSTAEKIIREKCVPMTWENDDDEEEKEKDTPSILEYFAAKRKAPDNKAVSAPKPKRHFFFTERCLNTVTEF